MCPPRLSSGCGTLGVPAEVGGPWGGAVSVSEPGGQGGSGVVFFPRHQAHIHSRGPASNPSSEGQRLAALLWTGVLGAGGGALRPGRLAPPCDVHVHMPERDYHAGRHSRGAARALPDSEWVALPGGRRPAQGCLPTAPGGFALPTPGPDPGCGKPWLRQTAAYCTAPGALKMPSSWGREEARP